MRGGASAGKQQPVQARMHGVCSADVPQLLLAALELVHALLLLLQLRLQLGHVRLVLGAKVGLREAQRRGLLGAARAGLGLGVALHHDVVDVRLQRHADVLALTRLKLEDVQHARDAHLEEHGGGGGAKLHDVAQLRAVQVLLQQASARRGGMHECKLSSGATHCQGAVEPALAVVMHGNAHTTSHA